MKRTHRPTILAMFVSVVVVFFILVTSTAQDRNSESLFPSRINEYEVVRANTTGELEKRVKEEYLNYGWQPVGGVAISDEGFFQAVVK